MIFLVSWCSESAFPLSADIFITLADVFPIMASVTDLLPVLLLILTLAGASIQVFLQRRNISCRSGVEVFLVWFLGIMVGVVGIWSFIGHTVFAAQVAQSIGWPPGNPFQTEVALTNLAFGVLGLLSVKIAGSFRLATIIGYSIFLVGAGIGHIYQYIVFSDTAPGNTGIPLYLDFIVPLILCILYYLVARGPEKETSGPA